MPPTRPPYPLEFKEEAVRLMHSSQKPLAQTSRDLGVSEQTLRNWRKQLQIDAGEREGLYHRSAREELGKLRREVRVLRQEKETLRKARNAFGSPSSPGKTGSGDPLWVHLERSYAEGRVSDLAVSCRVLKVSRSGYYAWRERPPSSRRSVEDSALTGRIEEIHERSRRAPPTAIPGYYTPNCALWASNAAEGEWLD